MKKTSFYIDGFNLYHAIDELGNEKLKWLNLNELAKTIIRRDEEIDSVNYFTSQMVWMKKKVQRHKEYLNALESVKVTCIISRFQTSRKYCKTNQTYCKFHEEKQTDVAFATKVITDAINKSIDRVVLITADSDQIPTIEVLRSLKPDLEVSIYTPPDRLNSARELNKHAHNFDEIKSGRLEKCLFPRNIKDKLGKVLAVAPKKYQID